MNRLAAGILIGVLATWLYWEAFTYGRNIERRVCVQPAVLKRTSFVDWERFRIHEGAVVRCL